MQSLIQILKVNEARSGTSKVSGKPYTIQEAECLLLKDDGSVDQVGVLTVPRDLVDKIMPGTFMGTFALAASYKDRRIEAVLTGLSPYTVQQKRAA